jgi:hypothetical protein
MGTASKRITESVDIGLIESPDEFTCLIVIVCPIAAAIAASAGPWDSGRKWHA